MTVRILRQQHGSISPLFVKCSESFLNLHTLEFGRWVEDTTMAPLKGPFEGVKLPQIKNLFNFPAFAPHQIHSCWKEWCACPGLARDNGRSY